MVRESPARHTLAYGMLSPPLGQMVVGRKVSLLVGVWPCFAVRAEVHVRCGLLGVFLHELLELRLERLRLLLSSLIPMSLMLAGLK